MALQFKDINTDIFQDVSALLIPKTLSEYKVLKNNQIVDNYNIRLLNGFSSNATGNLYIFGYGQSDQMKFMQLIIDVFNGNVVFPIYVPALDNTLVVHNLEQYQQLIKDISAFAWSAQTKLHELQGEVNACNSIEEIDAIDCSISAFDYNPDQIPSNSDSKSLLDLVGVQKTELEILQKKYDTLQGAVDFIVMYY